MDLNTFQISLDIFINEYYNYKLWFRINKNYMFLIDCRLIFKQVIQLIFLLNRIYILGICGMNLKSYKNNLCK